MEQSSVTDAVLWGRSLEGDGAAFGSLFDRHRDRLLRHAYRLVDGQADAEDVTAVAFLELWRCRHRVHVVNESVLPWLLVTTTNIARNAVRGRRRYERFLATLPPPDTEASVDDALVQRLDNEERSSFLRSALTSLSPRDQNLLLLTEVEGLSIRDAGEAMGITYGAAKTGLSRARSRLRNKFAGVTPVGLEESSVS